MNTGAIKRASSGRLSRNHLALFTILALGCGKNTQPEPPEAPPTEERAAPSPPPPPSIDEAHATWEKLLAEGKSQDAIELCRRWGEINAVPLQVESYKCLANAALAQSDQIQIMGDDAGGGSLGPGPSRDNANRAIEYLRKAIALDSSDLSLHQGRLHILMVSGAFGRTADALRDSLGTYKGEDGLSAWLAYSPRFMKARQYKAAIEFLHVLEVKYPNDHRVIANLGGFYGMLEDDNTAFRYAKRAVELAPEDPFNNWNLGRLYDYTGNLQKADEYYSRGLKLFGDPSEAGDSYCMYAKFLNDKRRKKSLACKIATERCPDLRDKYCVRGSL